MVQNYRPPAQNEVIAHRIVPGICVVDSEPIRDAVGTPELGEGTGIYKGYVALLPELDSTGEPLMRVETGDNNKTNLVHRVPAFTRALCRGHFLEEFAARYPDQGAPVLPSA